MVNEVVRERSSDGEGTRGDGRRWDRKVPGWSESISARLHSRKLQYVQNTILVISLLSTSRIGVQVTLPPPAFAAHSPHKEEPSIDNNIFRAEYTLNACSKLFLLFCLGPGGCQRGEHNRDSYKYFFLLLCTMAISAEVFLHRRVVVLNISRKHLLPRPSLPQPSPHLLPPIKPLVSHFLLMEAALCGLSFLPPANILLHLEMSNIALLGPS